MTVMSAFNEPRPPFIEFQTRPTEDRVASNAANHVVMKDEEWVIVRQIGSKDCSEHIVKDWLSLMEEESRRNPRMMPPSWVAHFKERYAKWKAGEEQTVNGTAVRSVSFLTPAEIANLMSAQIYSVEDAAVMNDEAMRRCGLGALRTKQKCEAWLRSREDGKAAYELNQLRETCELQKMELEDERKKRAALEARLTNLEAMIENQPKGRKAG